MRDQKTIQSDNMVLVVGGGVGGIRTALDLAEAGRNVVLIDKTFSIGGLMTQLDRTFPTNNCDLCTLSPHLSESGRELHIELMTMTRLNQVEGEAGRFTVTLQTEPRYIDLQKCTACGDCYKHFPECVRFTPGLDHRAPTCMRYPQATPYAYSVAMDKCANVESLVRVCRAGAILPEDSQKTSVLEVGAIVLAPGADLFDPAVLDTFGYGTYPNVVTSLEYERILSASGPTHGQLVRPSDGQPPKKIAWLQCVGSRGLQEASVSYCSSACCMFALKEAIVTKERFQDDIEATIFFMDMRTSGKDYEQYYQRAKQEFGVRFVRSRPHSVLPDPTGDNLSIAYVLPDSNALHTEAYDMVVLSTGFRVSAEVQQLAASLGIEVNQHQFAKTSSFAPVTTSKPGIYVCGLYESPKDIPETMVQASAAACNAALALPLAKAGSDNGHELPMERDVSGEEPRVGVFLCDCGFDIGGIIDIQSVAETAKDLPQVAAAEVIGHGCSRESLERIQTVIAEQKLNRVVIGSCSPRTHETLFQDTIRKAGLNKYLLEIANIRDQDTWVHLGQPDQAAAKARELIRMAVASVSLSRPLTDHLLHMNQDVLVVGGGVAGMNAALSLADLGFKVYLAERSGQLGGVAAQIRKTLAEEDVPTYVNQLIEKTSNHEHIQVLLRSVIVDHSGMAGMFNTGLQVGPQMHYRKIQHGITILATGALPNRPPDYLLGQHRAVRTQLELDNYLEDHPDAVANWDNVVMIQCVGSRCRENPNCSRICCESAVKNALRIRQLNPEARMFILYRDMRTFGFQEDYYRQAREQGVIFVRYEPESKPLVTTNGNQQVMVTFDDPILGRKISVEADCLALSTGLVADDESTEDLATIFHLPRTNDGYFLEDHIKLRPVDLPIPGFFVAGTAHSPKGIRESIAQAQAAAGRAQTFLARDTINLGAVVARVDGNLCASCLICVRSCPFEIPFINADGYSEIDPAKCHGCGVCAAECPAKAIQLMRYEDGQIIAKLDGLLERML